MTLEELAMWLDKEAEYEEDVNNRHKSAFPLASDDRNTSAHKRAAAAACRELAQWRAAFKHADRRENFCDELKWGDFYPPDPAATDAALAEIKA